MYGLTYTKTIGGGQPYGLPRARGILRDPVAGQPSPEPPLFPFEIPAATFHVDADEVDQTFEGTLNTWRDLSGNGRHLTRFNAQAPSLQIGVVNNRNAVRFSGSHFIDRSGGGSGAFTGYQHTIFVAFKANKPGSDQFVFDTGTDSSTKRRYMIIGSAGITFARDGGGGSVVNGNYVTGTPLLATCVMNGASSKVWINGSSVTTGTISTASEVNDSPIAVGARYSADAAFLSSDVYKIAIYNSVLSDSERENVNNVIMQKYAF